MKKLILILGLFILTGCTKIYENEYGIGYTDPNVDMPEALEIPIDYLEGYFFAVDPSGFMREKKCIDGTDPKVAPLYNSDSFLSGDDYRNAYICQNKYVIEDFLRPQGHLFYGPFKLEDHSEAKIDVNLTQDDVYDSDPDSIISDVRGPIENDVLYGEFFAEESSSEDRKCLDGTIPETTILFEDQVANKKRSAILCGYQYVLEDFDPTSGTLFYGPYEPR